MDIDKNCEKIESFGCVNIDKTIISSILETFGQKLKLLYSQNLHKLLDKIQHFKHLKELSLSYMNYNKLISFIENFKSNNCTLLLRNVHELTHNLKGIRNESVLEKINGLDLCSISNPESN